MFQLLGDSSTRFSSICVNTVIESSETEEKEEIQVLWVAPSPGFGCIKFTAAVIELHR